MRTRSECRYLRVVAGLWALPRVAHRRPVRAQRANGSEDSRPDLGTWTRGASEPACTSATRRPTHVSYIELSPAMFAAVMVLSSC